MGVVLFSQAQEHTAGNLWFKWVLFLQGIGNESQIKVQAKLGSTVHSCCKGFSSWKLNEWSRSAEQWFGCFVLSHKRIERCRSVEAMDCPIGKRAWHRNWLSKRILEWSTVVLIVGYLFFLVGFFLLARSLRSLACLSLDLKVSLLVIPSLRSVIF